MTQDLRLLEQPFSRVFGGEPLDQGKPLLARSLDTPLGAMLALANDSGICLLEFQDGPRLEAELLLLRNRTGTVIIPGSNRHLDGLCEELTRYFGRTTLEFTVPPVMIGTPFERRVWELLVVIPPGETRSYGQIAALIGSPSATRAVGRANGKNSLAVLVPCHRLIGADGRLCGYGGGLWRKKWLLEHECRVVGRDKRD